MGIKYVRYKFQSGSIDLGFVWKNKHFAFLNKHLIAKPDFRLCYTKMAVKVIPEFLYVWLRVFNIRHSVLYIFYLYFCLLLCLFISLLGYLCIIILSHGVNWISSNPERFKETIYILIWIKNRGKIHFVIWIHSKFVFLIKNKLHLKFCRRC